MPKYNYHLTNGKQLTLEGDAPPSDSEVESVAKEQGVQLQLSDTTPEPEAKASPIQQTKPIETKQETKPEPQGWLSKAWHAISDPLTDAPSRFANSVADYIDQPSTNRGETSAYLHGLVGGSIKGIGDVASGLTSPINLATMLATGGESAAAERGFTGLSNLLGIGAKVASAPMAAHGAEEIFNPESTLAQRGFGVAELAGGLAGMKGHAPSEKPSGSVVEPRDSNIRFATKAEMGAATPAKFDPLPINENESISDYIRRNGI